MNRMKVGWYYAQVCRCGAVLKSIEVTPFNAVQVAKFNQNANRCGYDTEHVTAAYIATHQDCTCEAAYGD